MNRIAFAFLLALLPVSVFAIDSGGLPGGIGTGGYAPSSTVTTVTGTAPIVSSGGTTPAISISAATTSAAGSMSAADKTKLDAYPSYAGPYAPSATAATMAGIQAETYTAADDTGAANAYAISITPTPTLAAYSWFSFKAAHANTGDSTLAVNGGAAKHIYKYGGTIALSGGEIQAGQIVRVIYDGTNFQMQSQTARPNVYMQTEYDNGTCTTAATITPVNGARQKLTLTNAQACALTFTQPTSGTAVVGLKIIQSATESYNGTISGCKWAGAAVPTITATTGAVDFISIYLDGTNAYCAVVGQDLR